MRYGSVIVEASYTGFLHLPNLAVVLSPGFQPGRCQTAANIMYANKETHIHNGRLSLGILLGVKSLSTKKNLVDSPLRQ